MVSQEQIVLGRYIHDERYDVLAASFFGFVEDLFKAFGMGHQYAVAQANDLTYVWGEVHLNVSLIGFVLIGLTLFRPFQTVILSHLRDVSIHLGHLRPCVLSLFLSFVSLLVRFLCTPVHTRIIIRRGGI